MKNYLCNGATKATSLLTTTEEDAFAEVYESFLDELDTDQFFFD